MTKVHSYYGEGSFGTSWHVLDPILTEALKERSILDLDKFICIQDIEINPEDRSIRFEYHIHEETEVEEID